MVLLGILFLSAIFVCALYFYFTRTYNYWKSRNVPGPTPKPFFGNLKDLVLRKPNTSLVYKELYDEHPNEKVIGIYRMTTPCLLVRDPDLVKHILIKEFDNFPDRGLEYNAEHLGNNLFHADEELWRPLRQQFTPLFTSGKLKNMVYLMVRCGNMTINYIEKSLQTHTELDVLSVVQRFTMSSISACAFGLDIEVENQTFMKTFFDMDKLMFGRNYVAEVDMMYPGIFKKLNLPFFSKEIGKFFKELVENIIKSRNNTPTNRHDFMDLLLELRQKRKLTSKNGENQDNALLEITDEVIESQAFVFFAAGYETSASTMTFALYELAMQLDVQEKVIAEVDQILKRHNGNITYDSLNELSYLDKVFKETLRMYPIADPYTRVAKTDCILPETNVKVKKGQMLIVSPLGIQRDEKYYPKPDQFDPERFSTENSMNRHSCVYLPFSLGMRNCIGMRFARIQSLVLFVLLFSKYRVVPTKKTPRQINFNPMRVVLSPKDNLFLKLIPRNDIN